MIYIFLADGFEETEAITPLDYIRRCEQLNVTTVGIGSKIIRGSHGIPIVCDITDDELVLENIDMIILPGGMPGTLNLEKSKTVIKCIDYCYNNGIYIAAICAAPSILGHLGLLNQKKAVCYTGFEDELIGAEVLDIPVCSDGKIITSRGAGTANQFAFEIIKTLCGEKRAELLISSVCWVK